MKIIDLLNKIANGEEVPQKIKWGEFMLEWEELGFHDYKFLETGNYLLFQGFATCVLNDEVEIIEDKEIEKIEQRTDTGLFGSMVNDEIKVAEAVNKQANYISDIVCKINEIIEVINNDKSK